MVNAKNNTDSNTNHAFSSHQPQYVVVIRPENTIYGVFLWIRSSLRRRTLISNWANPTDIYILLNLLKKINDFKGLKQKKLNNTEVIKSNWKLCQNYAEMVLITICCVFYSLRPHLRKRQISLSIKLWKLIKTQSP